MTKSAIGLSLMLLSLGTPAVARAKKPDPKAIERGKYLVLMRACSTCHTPKVVDKQLGMVVPDATRLLSGHPAGGPDPLSTRVGDDLVIGGPQVTSYRISDRAATGMVYAANLTPDKETGLGKWTEKMFVQAMRTARHEGGGKKARPILLPMVWRDLRAASDDDLKAIFAYLQSLPPIKNLVPPPQVSAQELAAEAAAIDKELALPTSAIVHSPSKPTEVQRGEYLVRFGGCIKCHTPWSYNASTGAVIPDMSRFLSGHPAEGHDPASSYVEGQPQHDRVIIGPSYTSFRLPFGVVYAPNLTPDKDTGLGSWTEEMFINGIRNGRHMGGYKSARPILMPMIWRDMAHAPDEDLKAMFAYLKSIPPIRNAVPDAKVSPEMLQKLSDMQDKELAGRPIEIIRAP